MIRRSTNPAGWYLDRFFLAMATVLAAYAAFVPVAPRWAALIAAALVVLGPQAEAWYRLGPQEAYATPLLLVGVALMLRGRVSLGLLMAVLAAFTKESFVPFGFLVAGLAWWLGARRQAVAGAAASMVAAAGVLYMRLTRPDLYLQTRTLPEVVATGLWMARYGLWPFALASHRRALVLGLVALGLLPQAVLYAGLQEGRNLLPWVALSAGLCAYGLGAIERMRVLLGRAAGAAAVGLALMLAVQVVRSSVGFTAWSERWDAFVGATRDELAQNPGAVLLVTADWPSVYEVYEPIWALRQFIPEGRAMLAPMAPSRASGLDGRLGSTLVGVSADGGWGYDEYRPPIHCVEAALGTPRGDCVDEVLWAH